MPKKTNNPDRKPDLEALEKRGAELRQASADQLEKKKTKRKTETTERSERQQFAMREEEKSVDARKKLNKKIREEDRERSREIDEMKRIKKEQQELVEKKREEKKKAEAKQKEYMINLDRSAAVGRMKARRKREASMAKEEAVGEANAETRKRYEQLKQLEAMAERKIEQNARKDRGDSETTEKQLVAEIEEETARRRSKIRMKEQMEVTEVEQTFHRKRSILPGIKDPSLRTRTSDEIDRDEKKQKDRVISRYQKMFTDLEIERTKRLDEVRTEGKKQRDTLSVNERQSKQDLHQRSLQSRTDADREFKHKIEEAKDLEEKILHMTFEEMAAEEKERTQKTSVKMDDNKQDESL